MRVQCCKNSERPLCALLVAHAVVRVDRVGPDYLRDKCVLARILGLFRDQVCEWWSV